MLLLSASTVGWAHRHAHRGHDDHDHRHLKRADGGQRCRTKELTKEQRKEVNKRFGRWRRERKARADRGEEAEGLYKIKVPTVFHIIANQDGDGLEAVELVDKQMRKLNQAFRPHGFRFYLLREPKVRVNTNWYEQNSERAEENMKKALRVGNGDVLNVYTG